MTHPKDHNVVHHQPDHHLKDKRTDEPVGTLMDSRQTLLERDIADSEARYRLLTENSLDLIIKMSPDCILQYTSPSITGLLGYRPDEMIGRSAEDLVYPPDLENCRKTFAAAAAGEDVARDDYRLLHKNGSVVWVDARPRLLRDQNTGEIVGVTDVIRDVTARKAAEQALVKSEARFRLLADNAGDIVTESGLDGRFRYVSPVVEAITGFTPEEVIGGLAVDFVHPDDRERVVREIAVSLSTPNSPQIEHRHIRKDGRVIWVESRPTLARDPVTGKPFAITDVLRDITARKGLELELQKARTAAEAATVVKSQFLSNMSHELRTPLTSILGFSSLLAGETGLTDQGRRAVERVNGSSQALLTIVNDILDFSKLESGQVEIDRRYVDPDKVLRDALGLLEFQAQTKGLQLAFKLDGVLPSSVSMDDGRVRQILLNLVSNAVKFTQSGVVTLAASYDAGRERLRCEVIDTGVGIPADRLDRLFKRFSQVDASTTRAFGGTGLGLAICKGLVDAMGGEIGVASGAERGACFWFELPCPAAVAKPGATAAVTHGADDALDGLRILVADDNPINRELVRVMLGPHGVQITEVENGQAAVSAAEEAAFDLILMDMRMPVMDGPTAARLIREGGGPNDIAPILAFSANDAEDGLSGGETCLFDGRIAKPISPADLISTVARWAAPDAALSPERQVNG